MAYVDSVFQVYAQESVVGTPNNPITLGTTTASGTNSFAVAAGTTGNGGYEFPKFVNPMKINNIRVYVGTAPASNVTGLKLTFLNGTSTIGQATVGTNTAGTTVDGVMTALSTDSHGVVTGGALFTTAGGQIAMVADGTGTASAQALGSYAIDLVLQNYFAS